jgi:hypothetical protein
VRTYAEISELKVVVDSFFRFFERYEVFRLNIISRGLLRIGDRVGPISSGGIYEEVDIE